MLHEPGVHEHFEDRALGDQLPVVSLLLLRSVPQLAKLIISDLAPPNVLNEIADEVDEKLAFRLSKTVSLVVL